jgi:hypothetical protein
MSTQNHVGSNLPQEVKELPRHAEGSEKPIGGGREGALGAGSFTTFWTWRGNGVVKALRFNHGSVNANSRVLVSPSEFNSDAAINRFIGDARMGVYNVAPFNGGFFAWVEVSWNSPLNVRFDVLIDP